MLMIHISFFYVSSAICELFEYEGILNCNEFDLLKSMTGKGHGSQGPPQKCNLTIVIQIKRQPV